VTCQSKQAILCIENLSHDLLPPAHISKIRHESTAVGGNCGQNAAEEQVSLLEGKYNPTKDMKLAVFDLDGTLTATNAVDDACFVRALRIVFDIDLINTNWTAYSHVTDASVMAVAFGEKHDRDPEPAEISRFIECFVALLNEECPNRPDLFGEIPGAVAFLAAIRQHSEWRAAIATGGWERSARFKMMASQIDADGMPAAFAEDGPARETIVEAAIIRACAAYATSTFEKIVLVGDAIWDVRTARRLGLRFVGVGSGDRATALRSAGAGAVIENFLNYEYCMECFESAAIPTPAGDPTSRQD